MVQGSERRVIQYTLIFPASALGAFNGEDYVVNIDVDLATGKDRLAHGVSRKRLDALIAAAVEAAAKRD